MKRPIDAELLEAQAHWICCPMCDRETCNRNADDCDVKKWIEKKNEERGEENDMEM